ncbi:ubiquitin-like-conjugating enzyme ATG10 isoform X1 [Ziziphus jujuba]|uniref:Ubiquitin-like-conjugating enzyme ATG10 n=1 Tax=Ziziphus jujuba TaxID=326968 RepID=A0A6P4AD54_ZIZJJ|nr:ubiquitin-like-conjugating enzyme ATG10 isoform X1 [Ziziphus jujuba]
MDVSSWDGTLSPHEFSIAARTLAHEWKRFNPAFPPWTWVPSQNRLGLASHNVCYLVDGYLTLEKLCIHGGPSEIHMPSQEEKVYEEIYTEKEELSDNATLVESNSCELHFYDFHIVYSAAYRVPVLYFRVYSIDGQPLVLDELKDLPACSEKLLLESKWTFITQEEHPHLNRPWYMLHPCGTSEWMKLLFSSDASLAKKGVVVELYLVSWLSVVGQVVGLTIPFELLNCLKSSLLSCCKQDAG